MAEPMHVYVEVGKKRAFAGALEWPGWCRGGRDEASALQALFDYGARYADAIASAGLEFETPASVQDFVVCERLAGGSTTDFGAPEAQPTSDHEPVHPEWLSRLELLLRACWQSFDATVEAARGRELRTGPRGGGRDLDKVVEHVLGADSSYLASLGWKKPKPTGEPPEDADALRRAILEGLRASVRGEIPTKGPRGGERWPAPYFVRRSAWHILDHVWEIEDRVG